MFLSYNNAIPQPTDNPSQSQGQMLTNFGSIYTIMSQDHYTFMTNQGGFHNQVHIPQYSTSTTVISEAATEGSLIYSKAAVADATRAQLSFKNNFNLDFPLSIIKAYGVFDTNGATINSQSLNLSSGAFVPNMGYLLTITANATPTPDRDWENLS